MKIEVELNVKHIFGIEPNIKLKIRDEEGIMYEMLLEKDTYKG